EDAGAHGTDHDGGHQRARPGDDPAPPAASFAERPDRLRAARPGRALADLGQVAQVVEGITPVHGRTSSAGSSCNREARAARPRDSRALIVPTGAPTSTAISATDRSHRWCSTI